MPRRRLRPAAPGTGPVSPSCVPRAVACAPQTAEELLAAVAGARGKLKKGGVPDVRAAARVILQVRRCPWPWEAHGCKPLHGMMQAPQPLRADAAV